MTTTDDLSDENVLRHAPYAVGEVVLGVVVASTGVAALVVPLAGEDELAKKWIQKAIKKPGALHKALHVPQGQKIPAAKLAKAAHSSNPKMRQRAALAKTLKRMH